MADFLRLNPFCTIFVAPPEMPACVVHVPIRVESESRFLFHVSRGNRAAGAPDGSAAILSCLGPDSYISPGHYGAPGQVPTWNYVAVEAEGRLRRLAEDELIDLIDHLSADHEARVAADPPWTRAKMEDRDFERLLGAITGFEMQVTELRGTRKLAQHKAEALRLSAAAAIEAAEPALARLMREAVR